MTILDLNYNLDNSASLNSLKIKNYDDLCFLLKYSFDNMYDLMNDYFNTEYCPEYSSINVVGNYDKISAILEKLIKDNFHIRNIELLDSEVDGYDGDWLLTIDSDGDIWTQKAVHHKDDGHSEYFYLYDSIIFVHEDVNLKLITKNKDNRNLFFVFNVTNS